jgi:tripartite-type tricarboxylate transporter receptor subunit TctC
VLARPEVQASYRALDTQIVADTPAEFGAFMQSELVRWRAMVKDAHVKLIE